MSAGLGGQALAAGNAERERKDRFATTNLSRDNMQQQMSERAKSETQRINMNEQVMEQRDQSMEVAQISLDASKKLSQDYERQRTKEGWSRVVADPTNGAQVDDFLMSMNEGTIGKTSGKRASRVKDIDTAREWIKGQMGDFEDIYEDEHEVGDPKKDPETGKVIKGKDGEPETWTRTAIQVAREDAEAEFIASAEAGSQYMLDNNMLTSVIGNEEGEKPQTMLLSGIDAPLGLSRGYSVNEKYMLEIQAGLRNKMKDPTGGVGSTRMDSYQQSMTAFLTSAGPRPATAGKEQEAWDKAYRAHNKNFATKSVAGVGEVKKEKALYELQVDNDRANKFRDDFLKTPAEADRTDLGQMQVIEDRNYANLDTKQKAQLDKDTEGMKARHRVVNAVDSLINDLDGGKLEGAKRGPIDNMINSAKKIIGEDTMTKEMAESMTKAIERDSRTGMILAGFLRATSGLTVTEEERTFLTNVMTGGNWNDEKGLITAIKSFRKQNAEENDVIAGTLFDRAPATATKYRKYDTYKTASSGEGNTPANTPAVVTPIVVEKSTVKGKEGKTLPVADFMKSKG